MAAAALAGLSLWHFGTMVDVLQEWGLLATAAAHAGRPHALTPSPAAAQGSEARNGTTVERSK